MNNRVRTVGRAAAFGLTLAVAACSGGGMDASSAPLDSENQKASYAIGLQIGTSLAPARDHVEIASFLRGVQDALAEKDPAIPPEELQTVLQTFTQKVQQEEQARLLAAGDENEKAGATYLEENGKKDGVTTTESGLQYEVMREGTGPKPAATDRVTIHYRGKLIDGTEFDSSYERGEPITFDVGGVIRGFSEGLQLMPVGSQYRFVIPGGLGYGESGNGGLIGPNATLIFEVEMIEIPS